MRAYVCINVFGVCVCAFIGMFVYLNLISFEFLHKCAHREERERERAIMCVYSGAERKYFNVNRKTI